MQYRLDQRDHLCVFQTSDLKMQTKRIIVEFGVRRQRVVLKDRAIPLSKLRQLIGIHFGIALENRSMYTLQMCDETLNAFRSLDENTSSLDLIHDLRDCHRFRILETTLRTRVRSEYGSSREHKNENLSVGTLSPNGHG